MSASVRVATPLEYLPRYLCPYDEMPLRYDELTNPETHETGAQCDLCGHTWIVTATSTAPHPERGTGAEHAFTLREVTA